MKKYIIALTLIFLILFEAMANEKTKKALDEKAENRSPARSTELKCEEAEIETPVPTQIMAAKSSNHKVKVCFDKIRLRVTSESCKNGDCELLKKAKHNTKPIEYKGQGTPYAIFCKNLGGQEQISFLKIHEEKIKVPLCVLGKDFASNTSLFEAR